VTGDQIVSRLADSLAYPETFRDRDRWIVARRGARRALDPLDAYGAFVEDERTETGETVPVATLLLTNRECPWRCVMCDLWKSTLERDTPPGAIPRQIERALARLPPARRIKLYNAGSLFDPRAVPPADDAAIARLVRGFDRVIVESHPALVAGRCLEMQERLGGRLEVAMGLETSTRRPAAPEQGDDARGLRRGGRRLESAGIAMRAFVLAGLPWVAGAGAARVDVGAIARAFDAGAGAVS
jgi:uncharacterized Fe-S cluster-containing MiaB family protein